MVIYPIKKMLIINIAMLEYQIADVIKSLEIHLKSTPQPLRIRISFASPSAIPWAAMGHGQREAADPRVQEPRDSTLKKSGAKLMPRTANLSAMSATWNSQEILR